MGREGMVAKKAGAIVSLPGKEGAYPVRDRGYVLPVGSYDREMDMTMDLCTTAAFDNQASEWCKENLAPPMPSPRSAVALCRGSGRVATARLSERR